MGWRTLCCAGAVQAVEVIINPKQNGPSDSAKSQAVLVLKTRFSFLVRRAGPLPAVQGLRNKKLRVILKSQAV